ncbi:MAG: hypothetical protein K2Q01_08045 [Rickettsiales bacterium]|nr:hypothetical protein [Rickettsiales bacterium]
MKKFLIAAGLASLLYTSPAAAFVVNYTGTNKNMGTVAAGQTGTLNNNFTSVTIPFTGGLRFRTSFAYGLLPAYSKITFTYSLANLQSTTGLNTGALYNYELGGDDYAGVAFANRTVNTAVGTINGSAAAPLVFASANLTGNTATTSILNTSAGFAAFETFFSGFLRGSPNLTYAVSAVPLPAALPMFAAALAGMFGFARKRRVRAVA